MDKMRKFDIAFVGLSQGIHEFDYEVDKAFFEKFGLQDFTDCDARIKVTLEKSSSIMLLRFDIDGTVDTSCDRCGNPLKIHLWDEFNLVVKLVEDPELMNDNEDDPDIYYIGRNESHLHLAKWIYDFVLLSIPGQKTCGEDENGNSLCNKKVLKMLRDMEERSIHHNHALEAGLKKINIKR